MDCEKTTTEIFWDAPTASDLCGGAKIVSYTCEMMEGTTEPCDPDWITNSGGLFPQGSWKFNVIAVDNQCGESVELAFTVTVNAYAAVDMVIQLSPVIGPEEITRCIEFELYEACSPLVVTYYKTDVTFGGPYQYPGHFQGEIKIPKGQYFCIEARDQLHTLAGESPLVCDSTHDGGTGLFSATFKGDPSVGGNWLIGGNLDYLGQAGGSPHAIDIIDYGIFVSQFLTAVDADTPCDDKGEDSEFGHADINGDGQVDDIDFSFIAINFLKEDKVSCCPARGGEFPAARTEISVRELNKIGLGHLAVADLNGDGMVDMDDMQAFMAGQRPKRPGSGR